MLLQLRPSIVLDVAKAEHPPMDARRMTAAVTARPTSSSFGREEEEFDGDNIIISK